MSGELETMDINGVRQDTFKWLPWTVQAEKSHILHSKCMAPVVCSKIPDDQSDRKCLVCRYEQILKLPSIPDMTFPRNKLRIEHVDGFGFEFRTLDALKLVSKEPLDLEVGVAKAWQDARTSCEFSRRNVVKPFDWTYSTTYQGNLLPDAEPDRQLIERETTERINIEKLRQKEEILYFDDIDLFEDELADHGIAQLSVKMRVMKCSFFVLLRYFLRVDGTKAKIQDTRFYYEKGTNYILKEQTIREAGLQHNPYPNDVLTDPIQLSTALPLIQTQLSRLDFPI